MAIKGANAIVMGCTIIGIAAKMDRHFVANGVQLLLRLIPTRFSEQNLTASNVLCKLPSTHDKYAPKNLEGVVPSYQNCTRHNAEE